MSAIWYIGYSSQRIISIADWAAAGISATADTVWNASNGWSVPFNSLSSAQRNRLDGGFWTAAPDGPRVWALVPRPNTEGPTIPETRSVIMPGQEIGYCIYDEQFTATSNNWEIIPGLELGFPTGDRPVYITIDLGLVAVEGAVESATSIAYRILDITHGKPIISGYVTADRRAALNDGSEYLLSQSVPLTARLPAGLPDSRYVVQVQVPSDQLGPAWYFNVAWAEGIDLIIKAVTV